VALGRLVFSQKPKDVVRQAKGWWRATGEENAATW
jgi:hypothetical protein